MKLLNVASEKKAIRTIAAGTKAGNHLLASINADCFHYPPCVAAFNRISSFLKRRGSLLTWEELLVDPALDERVRKEFTKYERKPYKTLERGKKLAETLVTYRRIRKLYYSAEHILTTVKKPSVDVEKLIEEVSTHVTQARMTSNTEEIFLHFGEGDNAAPIIRDILLDKTDVYLPTGFDAFDRINRGLPVGGLTIVAGTTGGGKTTFALQLCRNIAESGARTCLLSLEMDKHEVAKRRMCNLTQIDMVKINNPKTMTTKEKKLYVAEYKAYRKRLRRKGGTETIVVPEEDISMEEALYLLKPYAYDCIVIDYIGLLRGMDEEDMWRKLSAGARFAKRFASINKCQIVLCAQFSDDGLLRYSRGMKEHASNMFTWKFDDLARETGIIQVSQEKSRNQQAFPFPLRVDFSHMTVRDLDDDERDRFEGVEKQKSSNKKEGDKKKHFAKKEPKRSGFQKAKEKGADDEYFQL